MEMPYLIDMVRMLKEIGMVKSQDEAKRLIRQGAVSIDGRRLTNRYAIYKKGT